MKSFEAVSDAIKGRFYLNGGGFMNGRCTIEYVDQLSAIKAIKQLVTEGIGGMTVRQIAYARNQEINDSRKINFTLGRIN